MGNPVENAQREWVKALDSLWHSRPIARLRYPPSVDRLSPPVDDEFVLVFLSLIRRHAVE